MTVSLKSVYFTSDGNYFDDRKDAERYEEIQELTDLIVKTSNRLSATDAYTVAEKLMSTYEMFKKSELKHAPEVTK